MIEVETGSFDDQLQALARLAPGGRGPEFAAALERARPKSAAPRSILVPSRELVPVAELALRVERDGEPVVLGHLEPEELAGFVPIDAVEIPAGPAHLAVDVDLGAASRNVRPEDALREILAAGRSPLTLDEGVALMLQQPGAIAPNWGYINEDGAPAVDSIMGMQDFWSGKYFTFVEKKVTEEQLFDLSVAKEAKARLDREKPFGP